MKTLILILSIMMNVFSLGCKTDDGGFRSMDVETFAQAISAAENLVILDSRTADEYASGHISGAVNIDVLKSDFEANALQTLDKGKTIAVYCRSGRRSKNAANILVRNGYIVIELDCGITCWLSAGKEVVR